MKQISFFPYEEPIHGGIVRQGRRKEARPLNRDRPVHLVLKSKRKIFFPLRAAIYREIREKADHFGIRLYSTAVNHDHIHFIVRIYNENFYRGFIRALTGVIARRYGTGLWKLIPFTRVMNWGKDFKQGLAYLLKNREEASGARTYEPRKDWYSKWRKFAEAA
jgi:REP element-mobilizing transposase RayT